MLSTGGGVRIALLIVGAAALQAGCGGSIDVGDDAPFDQVDEGVIQLDDGDVQVGDVQVDDDADVDGGTPGALEAGPVTVSAEPGHAVVTVDDLTIDHTLAEFGGAFRCTISDEQVSLDVTSDFGSMVLTASRMDDGWIGGFTADSDEGDEDSWIQYGTQPFQGELGIDVDANTLSYVGAAMRQDRNAMAEGDLDTPTVEVTVAVNCGIDPATVEVGGETMTFPLFEADSLTCAVAAPDSIDVIVNALSSADRQLQFDVRPDGDGLIGGVTVIDGDDRWSGLISTQGGSADGLTVDGSTATFTGTFEHTSDADPDLSDEVEGTATVTCPT